MFPVPTHGLMGAMSGADISAGVALALDFINGATSLDRRITFSRTSNATLTDSTGKIAYAPHNLVTNSEDFEAAAWTKFSATATANTTVSPDGTTTADSLVENTSGGEHAAFQQTSKAASALTYTHSIYYKAGSGSRNIGVALTDGTLGGLAAIFNTSGSVVLASQVVGTATGWTAVGAAVTAVGNGWFRASFTATTNTATRVDNVVYLVDGTTRSYTGNGTSGIFIWGAQLSVGALQSYNSTTPKNLLGFTQEFNNAAWVKSASSVTANTVAAPDGYVTADTYTSDGTSTNHRIEQTASAGYPKTFSVYAKTNTQQFIQIFFGADVAPWANFDLVNGVVGSSGTNQTASIQDAGNGWYRCSVYTNSLVATTPSIGFITSASSTRAQVTTLATNFYLWGAQLSNSASVDPYVYNPQAAPTSTAYYGPRFDYNPVTLAANGLLIEEQRTNLLTYSEQFDNAAWVKSNTTVTANSVASPDGTLTADTATAGAGAGAGQQLYQALTTIGSGSFVYSIYIKKGSGATDSNIYNVRNSTAATNFAALTVNYDTGVVTQTTGSGATMTDVGNGWWRLVIPFSSTATVGNEIRFYAGSVGGAETPGEFCYIWGAQLEAGSFATSYIPTVASQVTRAADNAAMLGDNFATWYNQTQGTVYSLYDCFGAVAGYFNRVYAVSDGSNNNSMQLIVDKQFNVNGVQVKVGGTEQAFINAGSPVNGAVVKFAFAYAANDFAQSRDGAAVGTDTSGSVPTSSRLSLGADAVGNQQLNGHIRSISYYPTRLSNATLQAITA